MADAPLPPALTDDVRAILSAPGVDLFTISAKRVRKELDGRYAHFDVKANKKAIDNVILSLFHEIKAAREAATQVDVKPLPSPPPPAYKPPSQPIKRKASPALTTVKTDEDVARALHAEINGGRRASRNTTTTPNGRSKSKSVSPRKVKKSDVFVQSSGDDDEAPSSSASPKKKKKSSKKTEDGTSSGTATGGYNKEMLLSPALSALLGVPMCSRPQTVKRIWEYIKSNNLQNPRDRREILCDDAMQNVFRVEIVNMFTMNKLLSDHLHKSEDIIQMKEDEE